MSATAFSLNKLLFVLLLLTGCEQNESRLPYYNTPDFTPHFIKSPNLAADSLTHTIPSFDATDQHGSHISESIINGKIHVANFFFTSCASICPGMMSNMKLVSDAFSGDSSVVLLSFSVTPWIDNVEVLRKYADLMGIHNNQWHLLTGKKSGIYSLARKAYFAEETLGFSKDSTEFLHTEHLILVDRKKHIRGIYNGTLRLEMKQLIADIKSLEEEVF